MNRKQWSDLVLSNKRGNIFQSPQMFEVYKNTNNYDSGVIFVYDENGLVEGLLLYRIQSFLRFFSGLAKRSVIVGGPLIMAPDSNKKILSKVIKKYELSLPKGVIYTEFRNISECSNLKNVVTGMNYHYQDHLNYVLDLSQGKEQLWKSLNKKRRNSIRRSQKEQIKVNIMSSYKDVEHSYKILSEVYKKARVPLSDLSLFVSAHKILQKRDNLICFNAYHKEILVGTIWILIYKNTMYNWFHGSKTSYLNKYPNDAIMWKAIEWGVEKGYNFFDLGGAGNPNQDYGVREFKKKFGGDEINPGRFVKIHHYKLYSLQKFFYNIYKKLAL